MVSICVHLVPNTAHPFNSCIQAISTSAVQLFYAWRILVLTHNHWIVGFVVFSSIVGGRRYFTTVNSLHPKHIIHSLRNICRSRCPICPCIRRFPKIRTRCHCMELCFNSCWCYHRRDIGTMAVSSLVYIHILQLTVATGSVYLASYLVYSSSWSTTQHKHKSRIPNTTQTVDRIIRCPSISLFQESIEPHIF